jgi:hypothetical protein
MKAVCALACGVILGTASLSSHHSFAAEFDGESPITVSGTVALVEWSNPHIHFYLDVTDDSGDVTQWRFEGYPPNMLVRQGWKRGTTLTPGAKVTVFGWRERTDPHFAHAREVTFADGRTLAAGPPAGTGGGQ